MTLTNEHVPEKKRELEVAVKKMTSDTHDLKNIKGIGKTIKERLIAIGISTVDQLAHQNPEMLAEYKGFGLASAEKFVTYAQQYLTGQAQTQLNQFTTQTIPQKDIINSEPVEKSSIKYTLEPIQEESDQTHQNPDIRDDIKREINLSIKESEKQLPDEGIDTTYGFETDGEEDLIEERGKEEAIEFEEEADKEETVYLPSQEKVSQNLNHTDVLNLIKSEGEAPKVTPELQEQKKIVSPTFFESELMDKTSLLQFIKDIEHKLKELDYTVLKSTITSFLQEYRKEIDLLGIKVIKIKESLSLILIIPLKISLIKGTMVISEQGIDYISSQPHFHGKKQYRVFLKESVIDPLYYVEQEIFQDMLSEGMFYRFCKKLTGNALDMKKSLFKKPLYLYANTMQYKIAIDPVIISMKEPACAEKSLAFPYQRKTNIHLIAVSQFKDFITFLEQKYIKSEIEVTLKNDISMYSEAKLKLWKESGKYSLPFISFGLLFLITITFQFYIVLQVFNHLGIAALLLYAVTLAVIGYRFFRVEQYLSSNLSTLPYLIVPKLEEIDLTLLQGQLSQSYLTQLIYEWYGKNEHFEYLMESTPTIGDVEIKGTIEANHKNIVNEEPSLHAKYKTFIED